MPDGQPGRRARSGQPDEMFGGNIGNEQRGADGEPADVAAGQEIILGAASLAGKIKADAENNDEVDRDDRDIHSGKVSVRDRSRRRVQHAYLLKNPSAGASGLTQATLRACLADTNPPNRRARRLKT